MMPTASYYVNQARSTINGEAPWRGLEQPFIELFTDQQYSPPDTATRLIELGPYGLR